MKSILKSILTIHILSLLFVNVVAFTKFTGKETERLNPFGKFFFENLNIDSIPKFIEVTVGIYSNLTGTNRGYEFFSPNVSKGSSQLIFIAENGKVIKLTKSIESEVKLLTATYYFNSYIFDEKMKNKILTSIGSRVFTINPMINEISVYIKFSKYNELKNSSSIGYNIHYENLLISKIKRNDN